MTARKNKNQTVQTVLNKIKLMGDIFLFPANSVALHIALIPIRSIQ